MTRPRGPAFRRVAPVHGDRQDRDAHQCPREVGAGAHVYRVDEKEVKILKARYLLLSPSLAPAPNSRPSSPGRLRRAITPWTRPVLLRQPGLTGSDSTDEARSTHPV